MQAKKLKATGILTQALTHQKKTGEAIGSRLTLKEIDKEAIHVSKNPQIQR